MVICTVDNCNTHKFLNKISYIKSDTKCSDCQSKIESDGYQKILCKSCGIVHYIRQKIRNNEESFIVAGYCAWCKQRKEEEDRMIEDGIIGEEDRTTEGGVDKLLNNLGIKKNDKPMSFNSDDIEWK